MYILYIYLIHNMHNIIFTPSIRAKKIIFSLHLRLQNRKKYSFSNSTNSNFKFR